MTLMRCIKKIYCCRKLVYILKVLLKKKPKCLTFFLLAYILSLLMNNDKINWRAGVTNLVEIWSPSNQNISIYRERLQFCRGLIIGYGNVIVTSGNEVYAVGYDVCHSFLSNKSSYPSYVILEQSQLGW